MRVAWQLVRTLAKVHSLQFGLAAALGLVLIMAVGAPFARDFYPKYITKPVILSAERGLQAELLKLSKIAEKSAREPQIIAAAETSDSEAAQSALDAVVKKEGIWGMSLTNADGTVLTRTTSPNTIADNAFFVRPHGRALILGAEAPASLEKASRDPSIVVLSAGRMVYRDGVLAGALFASQLPDDTYAQKFRDAYLPRGTEVAFYSVGEKIVGTSIEDASIRGTLKASLPSNQDIFDAEKGGVRLLRSKNGVIFTVSVYEAPGVEGSAGGLIILVPMPGTALALVGGFIIIPLLLFILIASMAHRRARSERRYVQYYFALTLLGGILFLTSAVLYAQFIKTIPQGVNRPYPLYNSRLRLLPEGGVFAVGFDQKIDVVLDTGDEEVNALALTLFYDPKMVEVERLDTSSSPCNFMLEQAVDTIAGTIRVVCSIADSGGASGEYVAASFYIRPKTSGAAKLYFGDDTQVLAKDGLGTDVLRTAQGASFIIRDSMEQTKNQKAFTLYSQSHSNAERWYKSRIVHMLWSDVGGPYKVSVFKEGERQPSVEFDTRQTSTTVELPSDGIFILSVEEPEGRFGQLIVRADTMPPSGALLEASDVRVKLGDLVRFRISAKDLESGLQRTAYLRIDTGLFFPVGKEMYVPFYSAGKHVVTLRAFDKAGNRTDTSIDIHVERSVLDRLAW